MIICKHLIIGLVSSIHYILESSFSCGPGPHKYVGCSRFLSCMRDNSSVKLPNSIMIQPPVLFSAITTVLYQSPNAVLTAYFLINVFSALPLCMRKAPDVSLR